MNLIEKIGLGVAGLGLAGMVWSAGFMGPKIKRSLEDLNFIREASYSISVDDRNFVPRSAIFTTSTVFLLAGMGVYDYGLKKREEGYGG